MGDKITDTSKTPPEQILLGAMVEGTSEHITNMEAKGQKEIVASQELPIEGSGHPAFAKWGFQFGEATDDIFRKATLPSGWTKEATEHSMWSVIKDDKGRQRAMVFYKAAFYDRAAHMNPCTYYSTSMGDDKTYRVVNASGEIKYHAKDYDDARNWLDKHYPDWRNPVAYWDE